MITFTFDKQEVSAWEIENDTVMGGKSTSTIEHEQISDVDFLKFSGDVSLENDGGFAQMIHKFAPGVDISGSAAILIAGTGDGKTYKLRIETDAKQVAYAHEFVAEESFSHTLVLNDFKKEYHGEPAPEKPELNPVDIRSIGVLIGNGQEEHFEIFLQDLRSVE